MQARSIQLEVELLKEIAREANIRPSLDLETLAFVIIRIGEAFLYVDVLSDRKPEIEKAVAAIRILASSGGRAQSARGALTRRPPPKRRTKGR